MKRKRSDQTVWITIGLPGSGKSTWAKKQADFMNDRGVPTVRINNDDIREELGIGTPENPWSPDQEKKVRAIRLGRIETAIKEGVDVIVDNTHLNKSTLNKLETWLKQCFPHVIVVEKSFTDVPVHVCIDRDREREKRGERFVGAQVILKMAREAGLEDPKPANPIDWALPWALMCDLDGTLALFGNKRNPYDASQCDLIDEPNLPVKAVIWTYVRGAELYKEGTSIWAPDPLIEKVFFFSGRTDKYIDATKRFLQKKCGFDLDNPIYQLVMRKDGDFRGDEIVKREMYDEYVAGKYNVGFVLDDRPKVVRMWKSIGLPVFNVGDGVEF